MSESIDLKLDDWRERLKPMLDGLQDFIPFVEHDDGGSAVPLSDEDGVLLTRFEDQFG